MNRRDFFRSAAIALGAGALLPKEAVATEHLDAGDVELLDYGTVTMDYDPDYYEVCPDPSVPFHVTTPRAYSVPGTTKWRYVFPDGKEYVVGG